MVKLKKIGFYALICLVIDQLIKLVVSFLDLNTKITIIPNFFYITYVQNDGAAWSILSGNRLLLIMIGMICLFLVYFFLIRNKQISKFEQVNYVLLVSGIMGNLCDRIIRGYVIDYLDFKIFNYYFPIFNLADIFIVIGTGLIIISLFKGEKDGKNSSNGKPREN